MLDKIYFDPEHPENHNVELTSLKNSLVNVFMNGDWVAQGLNNTIQNMITNSTLTIRNHPVVVDAVKDAMKQKDNDIMHKYGEFTKIEPSMQKKIQERTKAKLVARRDAKEKAAKVAVQVTTSS